MNICVYEEYSSKPIFHTNKAFFITFLLAVARKGKTAFGGDDQASYFFSDLPENVR